MNSESCQDYRSQRRVTRPAAAAGPAPSPPAPHQKLPTLASHRGHFVIKCKDRNLQQSALLCRPGQRRRSAGFKSPVKQTLTRQPLWCAHSLHLQFCVLVIKASPSTPDTFLCGHHCPHLRVTRREGGSGGGCSLCSILEICSVILSHIAGIISLAALGSYLHRIDRICNSSQGGKGGMCYSPVQPADGPGESTGCGQDSRQASPV